MMEHFNAPAEVSVSQPVIHNIYPKHYYELSNQRL